MAVQAPEANLAKQFSSPAASATSWAEGQQRLESAQVYWLSTVREDGRPHVTPLIAVWVDRALYFCTGPSERKAKNLANNQHCIITTGCNRLDEGLDVVVEGEAVNVTDERKLQAVADGYLSKYGDDWRFEVRGGAFFGEGGRALVFEVVPERAFGFGKGKTFSQTRWRF